MWNLSEKEIKTIWGMLFIASFSICFIFTVNMIRQGSTPVEVEQEVTFKESLKEPVPGAETIESQKTVQMAPGDVPASYIAPPKKEEPPIQVVNPPTVQVDGQSVQSVEQNPLNGSLPPMNPYSDTHPYPDVVQNEPLPQNPYNFTQPSIEPVPAENNVNTASPDLPASYVEKEPVDEYVEDEEVVEEELEEEEAEEEALEEESEENTEEEENYEEENIEEDLEE